MRVLTLAVLVVCSAVLLAQQTPSAPQTQPAAETATPAAAPSEPKRPPREEAWHILKIGAANKSTDRRVDAIGVLGLVPNNAEARHLAEAALDDSEINVRVAAANALGEMGARTSIPLLKKRIHVEENTGVVLACAKALLTLKDDAGYEVYYAVLTGQRKAKGSLISQGTQMLHDPKKLAEIGFEEGLGFIPYAGMGYSAYKFLTKDDTSPVRAAAARALAKDPDPESGKALANAVQDKSWLVRKAALDALAKRNDPTLLKSVVPAMEDDKQIVMYTAAAVTVHLTDRNPKRTSR